MSLLDVFGSLRAGGPDKSALQNAGIGSGLLRPAPQPVQQPIQQPIQQPSALQRAGVGSGILGQQQASPMPIAPPAPPGMVQSPGGGYMPGGSQPPSQPGASQPGAGGAAGQPANQTDFMKMIQEMLLPYLQTPQWRPNWLEQQRNPNGTPFESQAGRPETLNNFYGPHGISPTATFATAASPINYMGLFGATDPYWGSNAMPGRFPVTQSPMMQMESTLKDTPYADYAFDPYMDRIREPTTYVEPEDIEDIIRQELKAQGGGSGYDPYDFSQDAYAGGG